MIVLDPSAMAEFLVARDQVADEIRGLTSGERLAAPHAIDLEVASTLRGLARGGKLPADEAERALGLLGKISLRRYAHTALLPRIWQLRHNMWPCDAACVALAESLDARIVTLDAKIEKVPGIRCAVVRPH